MSATYAIVLAAALLLTTICLATSGFHSRVPVLLHNIGWIVALSVIGSGLIDYTDLSFSAWVFITALIAAFNLGAVIPELGRSLSSVRLHKGDPAAPSLQPLVTRATFYALLTAYTSGFLVFLSGISRTYGLRTLLFEAETIRADNTYLTKLFPLPARALFYLGPLILVIALNPWLAKPTLRRPERILVVAFLTLSLATVLQRTNIFYALLWTIGLAYLAPSTVRGRRAPAARQRRRVKRSVQVGLIGIAALVAFQALAIALNKTGEAHPDVQVTLASPIRNSWGSLFVYSSAAVVALGQLSESDNNEVPPPYVGQPLYGDYNPQYWGRLTFGPALKIVPIAEAVEPISPFIDVPFAFNTFTWAEPYYRDFREPGAVAIVFLSGMLMTLMAAKRSQGPHWLLLASLLVGLSMLAAFGNQITTTITMEMFVVVPLLAVRRPRDTAPERAQGTRRLGSTRSTYSAPVERARRARASERPDLAGL